MAADSGVPAHRFAVRVYYEDTDAAGIVYYANYLRFAERARTEWLRTLGFDHVRLDRDGGVGFAVRRCTVDYRRPARLDDVLEVATALKRARGASVTLEQVVRRGEDELVRLDVELALLDAAGRPARFPDPLRAAFGPLVAT
ncbi:MAG: tol-pal system-associated acyl-CoA thioesterase [Alphaproteobacteria bacterium]|nr:tol-pal system-associated acyl-CoA thioesterase [Alphaproteobacteria bacterium]